MGQFSFSDCGGKSKNAIQIFESFSPLLLGVGVTFFPQNVVEVQKFNNLFLIIFTLAAWEGVGGEMDRLKKNSQSVVESLKMQ